MLFSKYLNSDDSSCEDSFKLEVNLGNISVQFFHVSRLVWGKITRSIKLDQFANCFMLSASFACKISIAQFWIMAMPIEGESRCADVSKQLQCDKYIYRVISIQLQACSAVVALRSSNSLHNGTLSTHECHKHRAILTFILVFSANRCSQTRSCDSMQAAVDLLALIPSRAARPHNIHPGAISAFNSTYRLVISLGLS